MTGGPLEIDPTLDWVRTCDRPPVSFLHGLAARRGLAELNDLADGTVSSISPVSYSIAEGMRASECNSGSPGAWKAADGRIWFPTLRGVVAIDPAVRNRLPPPVVVEEAEGHYGLRGMAERANAIGGHLAVWSKLREGTEVELRVPARAAYAAIRRRGWFS